MHEAYIQLVSRLKKSYGSGLKSIILFGSHARGEGRPESDHDILLIIAGLDKNPLKRMRNLRLLSLDIPVKFNFIAKRPEELAENLTPLLLDVCVDGKVIEDDGYFDAYRKKGLEALGQAKLKRTRVGREFYWRFEEIPQREWELTWDGYHEFA